MATQSWIEGVAALERRLADLSREIADAEAAQVEAILEAELQDAAAMELEEAEAPLATLRSRRDEIEAALQVARRMAATEQAEMANAGVAGPGPAGPPAGGGDDPPPG